MLVFSVTRDNVRAYDILIGRTAYHLPYKGRVVEAGVR